MSRRLQVALWIVVLVTAYAAVAGIRYAFAHPELTDTQRVLRIGDALRWR